MKVSIVIPTYKRFDYLERLLKSIEKQTFKDFEVIVVDDCSPNVNDYNDVIEKYNDIFNEFIFIKKEQNMGAPHSRNIGIKRAKYNLIALVDDDDEWLPLKLEKQVEVFKNSDKSIGLVYTWTKVFNEEGELIHYYKSEIEGSVIKEILQECFIPSPSVMVRKQAIIDAGMFDETFPSCQDWDTWTKIFENGYQCKVIKENLTIYHKHSKGSIGVSKNALYGYKKYYTKHIKTFLKNGFYLLIAKKLFSSYVKSKA